MKDLKTRILLNRWQIEKVLKIVLLVQVLFNIASYSYPRWLTAVLPIITLFELSLLVMFYVVITRIESEILQNLDIEVLEKYISNIERRQFKGRSKNIYFFKLSNYYYILGQFEKSIELLKTIEFEKLPSGPYSALDYYFQAYLLRVKMKRWDKIENIKNHFLSYQSNKMSEYRKKEFYTTFLEIFDKLFIQKSSVSNLVLPENNPYEYVRAHYLYAVNALNQADETKAKSEFQKIIDFSDKLYMVKEAKRKLDKMR